MEREWGNGEILFLYIFSFSLYFLPLYPFPKSKIVSFCRKMLNMVLLSRMSQKNLTYALWENNSGPEFLGRIHCEKAPQVVRACFEQKQPSQNCIGWINVVLCGNPHWKLFVCRLQPNRRRTEECQHSSSCNWKYHKKVTGKKLVTQKKTCFQDCVERATPRLLSPFHGIPTKLQVCRTRLTKVTWR